MTRKLKKRAVRLKIITEESVENDSIIPSANEESEEGDTDNENSNETDNELDNQ